MNERGRKKILLTLLLVAGVLILAYLSYAVEQRQATRARRAAGSGAKTITVKPGQSFQSALDAAEAGDEIVLVAGTAYTGNFVLPKISGSAFVTVRSSRCSEIPAGERINPNQETLTATLMTPNVGPVLLAPARSHHYKFECLTFTQAPTVKDWGYNLIQLGEGSQDEHQKTLADVPHDFGFDRCIVRTRDDRTSLQRGITLNSASTTITNSFIAGIKWAGVETQAVAGWNGPGPFLIENNYLEAAGINILFGGAVTPIPNLVPSDIVIRNNRLYKRPEWQGKGFAVKNLLELKNARRVTITGNDCENSWPDGQTGWAVILNAFADGPSSAVEDVEISKNFFRNVSNGINLRGMDAADLATRMKRIKIADNLIENLGAFSGEGKAFQVLNGTEAVSFDHNTVRGHVSSVLILDALPGQVHKGLSFTNNLSPHGEYGLFGNGGSIAAAALDKFASGWSFAGNALYAKPDFVKQSYPPRNFFPKLESAALALKGTDGQPVGVRH
jgi:hypothetical protein